MEFRTTSKKQTGSLGALVGTKFILTLCLFWVYQILQEVSLGVFLFGLNLCSAIVFLVLQKPLSRDNQLTKHQWFRVVQVSLFSLICSAMWLTGLRLCGPVRTTLLWEHSDMALLGVINTILTFGSHPKSRGAFLFILGILTLLLFDNDQALSPKEHPEGDHSGFLLHFFYWVLSFLGVPDHKGGVVLLLVGTMLSLALRSSQRMLAVDLGGTKRLQALITIFQCIFVLPWGVFGLFSGSTPWFALITCLVAFSCISVVDFYIGSYAGQHLDSSHVSLVASLIPFITSLGTSCLNLVLTPQGSDENHHGLSMGVALAFIFLSLATLFLTRSARQAHGILIGYSAAGLPLYSSSQQTSKTGSGNWFRPVLGQILENFDSRRIFLFLLLNLAFTGVEMMYGLWTNSLGLISDGFHMLFDCTALFFGLFAAVMSHWKPTRLYSFGFARVEVLSGFINGLFLVVIACFILTEALGRLVDPPHIVTDRLLFVSVVGFIVNLIGIFTFHAHSHNHSHDHTHGKDHTHHNHSQHSICHSHENSNMQGVFLHILADTMGSVGVIISSLLVQQFGWLIADPICSLFISTLIVVSVIPLLKTSVAGLMLVTPNHTHINEIVKKLSLLDGVLKHTDTHFWQQGEQTIGTVHVQVAPSASEQKVAHMIGHYLRENGLTLLTTQVEKQAFINSELRVSYTQQQQQHNTSPQVYVDCGPQTGEIKNV